MDVAVGSTNPVKVKAVERTLERYEPAVTAVAVDSGVPEQPRSIVETVTGAETRARRALEATGAEYGIGLEGGVARLDGAPGLSLIMWAATTDGDRIERGSGPTLRLPDRIATRVDGGEELGPVMDDVFGREGIAERDGAAGVLTGGLTNRTRALGEAIACSAGPLLSQRG
jgi:inosine/xanthosine triphosphatase